jgi:chemotaxis protein methyltransferase CheR
MIMIQAAVPLRPVMSEKDFRRFRDFIYDKCGINLLPKKKMMLTGRLSKRLRELGISSFAEYFDYVTSSKGRAEELIRMIDVVTTNKTDFFREPKHFDFLLNRALPHLLQSGRATSPKRFYIWSAGCSSGEEPYTLAMVLSEFIQAIGKGEFSILATDISRRVLDIAQKGIYPDRSVGPVPIQLKQKYLMKGKGSQAGCCRIVPELRKCIQFQHLNLIEGRNFGLMTKMDIIFCRNVIIYFDRNTQIRLFEKFYNQLKPGGFLFIGHSETLNGINDQFLPVSVAVYKK